MNINVHVHVIPLLEPVAKEKIALLYSMTGSRIVNAVLLVVLCAGLSLFINNTARAQTVSSAVTVSGNTFQCEAGGFLPNPGALWMWNVNIDGKTVYYGPGPYDAPGDPYGVVPPSPAPFAITYFTETLHGTHTCEFVGAEYGYPVYEDYLLLWDDKVTNTFP